MADTDAVGWRVEPVIFFFNGDLSYDVVDQLMEDIRSIVVRHGGIVAGGGYGRVNERGESALPPSSTP